MSDLIDRESAIRAIEFGISHIVSFDGNGERTNYFESENAELAKAIERVKEIPSANQWIKCSDRLPNTLGCYLVWRPHFFGGEIGMPAICYFDGQNTWHDSYGVDFTKVLDAKDVTAWMPLPEYKGKE